MKSNQLEEILISGISGRLPKSKNLDTFWELLENGTDFIEESTNRWTPGIYGLPKRIGLLPELDKFDASFFGVHGKQAAAMTPELRILLEVSTESILDAGVNPQTLRGTRTGVFCGSVHLEGSEVMQRDRDYVTGFGLVGCNAAMMANRLSYFLDLRGPSFAIDTACSSSLYALHEAVQSIRCGKCDAALVVGTSIALDPLYHVFFLELGMLSPVGKCSSFDVEADGFVRAEAIVCLFIQRKDLALRSYGTIVHVNVKTDGFKTEGIVFPSTQVQAELIEETLNEANVSPDDVTYFEAHGTGTKVGDPQELNAISRVLCQNRTSANPLLIGSVKSNMGHSFGGAGIASVLKVVLANQRGILPANLHFKNPNPNIPALLDGRLKVVTENLPWNGGHVGVNSFGFGGANAFCLLRFEPPANQSENSSNDTSENISELPLLVLFSGRTKETTELGLQKVEILLKSHNKNKDLLSILYNIFQKNINGHPYRGFSLLQNKSMTLSSGTDSTDTSSIAVSPLNPSIWFVFSGMGSQYVNMGRDLYENFPIFRSSIEKCAEILKKESGIDLLDLMLNADEITFRSSVMASCCLIVSIQLSLVDLLTQLKIKPNGILGHSIGENVCAYTDNCLTRKQVLLIVVARALAIEKATTTKGAMAAVGLSWDQATTECESRDGVYPACYNSSDNVTISGEEEKVKEFVNNLQSRGIFAKEVNSSGMPFHCDLMKPAGEMFESLLKKIIHQHEEKERSATWISTSVTEVQSAENGEWSKRAGIKYLVNNLVSPVYFHDALIKIPEKSIVVEIGAHCLLQSILKRSLPGRIQLGLMHKDHADGKRSLTYLFKAIGSLFVNGLNPHVSSLYTCENMRTEASFPVSPQTPMISPLILWDHSTSHPVPKLPIKGQDSFTQTVKISLQDTKYAFLKDHVISNRIVVPAAAHLYYVWKSFAMLKTGGSEENFPVVFENVQLNQFVVIPNETSTIELSIAFHGTSGEFEITALPLETMVATGKIRNYSATDSSEILKSPFQTELNGVDNVSTSDSISNSQEPPMKGTDLVLEYEQSGFELRGMFRSIDELHSDGRWGYLKWTGNWVIFFDAMFQFDIVKALESPRFLCVPSSIDRFIVNPITFLRHVKQMKEEKENNEDGGSRSENTNLNTNFQRIYTQKSKDLDVLYCPGLELQGLKVTTQGKKAYTEDELQSNLNFQSYSFEYYFDDNPKSTNSSASPSSLSTVISIVLENSAIHATNVNFLELTSNPEEAIAAKIVHATENCTAKTLNYTLLYGQNGMLSSTSEPPAVSKSVTTSEVENLKDKSSVTSTLNKLKGVSKSESCVFDLVAVGEDPTLIQTALSFLSPGGFLLFYSSVAKENSNWLVDSDLKFELKLVSKKKFKNQNLEDPNDDSIVWLSLFRKVQCDSNKKVHKINVNVLFDHPEERWSWVGQIKLALEEHNTEADRIILYSENEFSGVVGLFNCLKLEPGGENVRCVFVKKDKKSKGEHVISETEINRQLELDLRVNIYDEEESKWGRYVYLPTDRDESKPQLSGGHLKHSQDLECVYLDQLKPGDFSSLYWAQGNLNRMDKNPHLEVYHVHYVPLNFKDALLATGRVPFEVIAKQLLTQPGIFGLEFSGTSSDGRNVMGLVWNATTFTTTLVTAEKSIWPVPKGWTMAEASTVLVAYYTAYLALVMKARIQKGETVLIHSGAGALGQACINVALSLDCIIYTTVSSEKKRGFLKTTFPQLTDQHIFYSRDTSFENAVKKATKGRGVDVVVNSLSGDLLDAGLRCCAKGGRFLELGKTDMLANRRLGIGYLFRKIQLIPILMDQTPLHSPEGQELCIHFEQGIQKQVVKPIAPIHTYSMDTIQEGFRFMLSGRSFGKIVVQMRQDGTTNQKQEEKEQKPKRDEKRTFKGIPKTYFHPDKWYIVVGGLGGFGLEMVQWMVERDARRIIIVSRSGIKTGYPHVFLRRWRNTFGAVVSLYQVDFTSFEETRNFFVRELSGKVIGGIFNLAASFHDALMENQTSETFSTAFQPKGQITFNLDQITRKFPEISSELNHFVCLSSIACEQGNPGQSNYAYANSAMERICESRKRDGLPALVIQYGAIADVGVFARTKKKLEGQKSNIDIYVPQSLTSCLKVLDAALLKSVDKSAPCIFATWIQHKEKSDEPSNFADESGNKMTLLEKVGKVLGIKDLHSNPSYQNSNLGDLGLDSLLVVEMVHIFNSHGHQLPEKRIRNINVAEIAALETHLETLDSSDTDFTYTIIQNRAELFIQAGFLASEGIVHMNSTVNAKAIYNGIDVTKCKRKKNLFIIHSAEGFVSPLKELASELEGNLNDFKIWGLQSLPADDQSSIAQIAGTYIDRIKSVQAHGPFYMAGFSFGAGVAFESCLQLEAAGEKVEQLVLLDGSPAYIRVMTHSLLSHKISKSLAEVDTEDQTYLMGNGPPIGKEAESQILIMFLLQFATFESSQMHEKLLDAPNLEKRIAKMCKIVQERFPQVPVSNITSSIIGYFKRVVVAYKYRPTRLLKAPCLLIKVSVSLEDKGLAQDYGLGTCCEGPIEIQQIQGDHYCVVTQPQLTKTVNFIKNRLHSQ